MPTRTSTTEAAYLSAGHRHLARALTRHPEITDPLGALIASIERDNAVLKPATTRLYRQELRAVVAELTVGRDEGWADALDRIEAALVGRRGTPPEPRTATRKVKDATEAEATIIFRHLARRAQGREDGALVCMLALYVYLVPRTGCRPAEWVGARVEGGRLCIKNAKHTNGRAAYSERSINLEVFKPSVIRAAAAFANVASLSAAQYPSFVHWRKAMAELLARACKQCELRRLSLYSFRHIAIATWVRAGLSPWKVAALAGHGVTGTARRHYARGSKGWVMAEIADADDSRVAALEARAAGTPLMADLA